jgi:hypothetical protein
MTYPALQFISEILNDFLKKKLNTNESKVILNRVVNADGSPPKENDNKIVFTLINIEEEISLQQTSLKVNTTNKIGKNFHTIYILVHSNFEYYGESLELLDATIDFFIENPIFNPASSPNFPVELERVRLEPINLTIEQICSLWSSIGAKYQPSVLYRVRLV